MSGRQFNLRIKGWAKSTTEKLDALARQSCQQIAENVVMSTPFDTGFLRGSWQPSLKNPIVATGTPDKSGAGVLSSIGLTVSGMKAGDTFFLTNNAAYAPYVEFGTSKMAGRFFVTTNVKKAAAVVRQVARELKL
jgi:HK97 gp10 family phage protein